ncbi:MAG: Clp1/GlmU family protein [Candidatus Bathyarchaeia archaeon]
MDINFHGGRQVNRTVEKGKTLLVDGPASVTVVSGKTEVFGAFLSNAKKVVIREGKRLPFIVEEAATFEISLGEGANIEEVEGSTIPSSWVKASEELSNLQAKPCTVVVLGAVDSGKSSFCTYLINRLLQEKRKCVILDGDLGQSDVGPPCTIAYAVVTKPITDLFSLEAKNAFFVGVTSPSRALNKVIEGLSLLKAEVLNENPDFIVVNTDGWVEGEDAVNYKMQLVSKLHPDLIFCIQQKDETNQFLNVFEKFRTIAVDSPTAIKQKDREKRKNLRELGYIKYLKNMKMRSLPLNWLKIEGNELFNLDKTMRNTRKTERMYEILGMKPLNIAESEDKIVILIGRKRWIDAEKLLKAEEFAKKKIVIARKGDEEGLLTGLYDANGKFLGIGILQELDYTRKTLKILTPVKEEISTAALGKVKLDKNLKEILFLEEENQSEFSTVRELF